MRSLIVNKPDDPVKFLIDRIEKPESKYSSDKELELDGDPNLFDHSVAYQQAFHIPFQIITSVSIFCIATRIVLVGPPGSKRKEIALGLTAHFSEEGKDF